MSTRNERRVGDTWGTIFHVNVLDFVPLPEQIQGLRIEGLRTGNHICFFVANGVFPSASWRWNGGGGDSLLKTERRDKGEIFSERTTV
jgi:hypothetical protein